MTTSRLADLDPSAFRRERSFPSPAAWEDQVLYFLMVDRFSDGQEQGFRDSSGAVVQTGTTPRFEASDAGNAVGTDAEAAMWRAAGGGWVGGTLQGVRGKIGYLARLGVTAIWVSPVLKQVAFQDTYHGYGVQNFLEVDRHFGTTEDLKDLVATAHEHGLYVILDVILNHTGNVFAYDPDRYPAQAQDGTSVMDPRWDGDPYRVKGFRDPTGVASLPFGPLDPAAHPGAWPDGAVWPAELQDPATFTQMGRISNWNFQPEYLDGDFLDLKNVGLGAGDVDSYRPSPALVALTRIYQYWIAQADLDGLRVDTVKHMEPGATRFFASAIHEFAQSIGKENFYLIAEITGGRAFAFDTLELTGVDAALGIDDIPDKLEYLVKGYRDPAEYFNLFRNSELVGKDSHTWFKDKVVTLYDDHDQVRKGENKARFCADDLGKRLALPVLALNATTLGIPCIYYGSEQAFDGQGDNDRYIRESMFGRAFGAFRSRGRHFFDEEGPLYRELAAVLAVRRRMLGLRRGRQYLRPISADGRDFGLPQMIGGEIRSVVPWSRIFADQETLCAINTDPSLPRTAWVQIDSFLHAPGDTLRCIHSTDRSEIGRPVTVHLAGGNALELTVPAAGFAIYQ